MTAKRYDLTIEQGATFRLPVAWSDAKGKRVDLTGYTARMQIRPASASATVISSLTTENGRIQLTEGTVTLLLSATETSALTPGSGVYDLELVSGSTVTRLLQGSVTISAEVTR